MLEKIKTIFPLFIILQNIGDLKYAANAVDKLC